jgi:hypothetical protein
MADSQPASPLQAGAFYPIASTATLQDNMGLHLMLNGASPYLGFYTFVIRIIGCIHGSATILDRAKQ